MKKNKIGILLLLVSIAGFLVVFMTLKFTENDTKSEVISIFSKEEENFIETCDYLLAQKSDYVIQFRNTHLEIVDINTYSAVPINETDVNYQFYMRLILTHDFIDITKKSKTISFVKTVENDIEKGIVYNSGMNSDFSYDDLEELTSGWYYYEVYIH